MDSTTHLVPHVEYPSLAASVHGNHPSISPNSYPVNSPFYLSGYESPTAVSSYVHSNQRSLPSGDRSLPLQHLCSIFQALHTSMNRLYCYSTIRQWTGTLQIQWPRVNEGGDFALSHGTQGLRVWWLKGWFLLGDLIL